MRTFIKNAVTFVHFILRSSIRPGDVVIDATCGNGNDTLLLCNLVGPQGKVFAFDVQEEAVRATEQKMRDFGLTDRSTCILSSHEEIPRYVRDKIDGVVFNLGFLPGGSRSITTKPSTTIKALENLLPMLKQGARILLAVYHGHETGKAEKEALEDFCSKLNQKEYTVLNTSFINQVNSPPSVLIIEKV